MKRSIRYLTLPAVLLGGAYAHADERPNYDAYYDKASTAAQRPAMTLPAAASDGAAVAFDTRRQVPRFLWAAAQKPVPPPSVTVRPESAARWYLDAYAHRYGLTPSDLANAVVTQVHDTGRGGIIVSYQQQIGGVEIYRGDFKVLMARNLELVAISGSPRASAAVETKARGASFKLSSPEAIDRAWSDLYAFNLRPSSFIDLKKTASAYGYWDTPVTPQMKAAGISLVEPFRAKKVFYPMPDRVVPAYYLEIQARRASEGETDVYAYVISAEDGRVLYRQSLTENAAYSYRVWADPDGRPMDGPLADYTPSPTGTPDKGYPAFATPSLIKIDGFNHNPSGVGDPWLPTGATQTLGNNVDAYTDDGTPDGYSNGDIRATVTSPGVFDRAYNPNLEPQANQAQSMAALTQLFYTTNWLHDYWYDSGFNEAAGNAQQNNFGRGGVGGDVLHAEGQDGAVTGSRNNANMSTPADGASPRMQMFLWSGKDTLDLKNTTANTALLTNTAAFGAKNFDLTAEAVLANDGVIAPATSTTAAGTLTDACEAFPANSLAGKIALIDRGLCNFSLKAYNAQQAGAIGAIIINNVANGPAPALGTGTNAALVTIPVLSTTLEEGNVLKAALQTGPVSLQMHRQIGTERDGTIDNSIIAHEWGHYLHHRLVNCGLLQCGGMSEGWGDFDGLQMIMHPSDDLNGTYAMAIYTTVSFTGSPGYFGIRRYPYSADMTKNGLTFKHISNGQPLPMGPIGSGGSVNSEVHNAGEIWAGMLFEGLISLFKESKAATPRYTFEQARRRMADYLVAGMKLTPVEPTFIEQRDAILAAAYAADPADANLLALAFAKRGAGSCAVAPAVESTDNLGLAESFAVQPNFNVLSLAIDESVKTCDKDGVLDADEAGKATITVMNTSNSPLTGTVITLESTTAGVQFPSGASVTIPTIAPFTQKEVTIDIALDKSITKATLLDLTAKVSNSASCIPEGAISIKPIVNYDNVPSASNIDTVESDLVVWKPTGDKVASAAWQRVEASEQNHAYRGTDLGSTSDTQFESPSLNVSATDPLVVSFKHRYKFETSKDATGSTYWDGGLIEVSADNGATWQDISTYVDPGYVAVIGTANNTGHNPIGGRKGFVGQSPSYPAQNTVTLSLGTMLAGKTAKIRFRIGSDDNTGDFGWEVDDLTFQGIVNTPFPAVIDNASVCKTTHPPVADAGPDQTVDVGDGVILDATASTDPDGDALTYTWTQTAGFILSLTNPTSANPTFVAPDLGKDVVYTFKLTVSDGVSTSEDTVDVTVKASATTTSTSTGTSSSTSTGSSTSASTSTSSGAGGAGGGGEGGGATTATSTGTGTSSGETSSSTTGGGTEPGGSGCGCSTPGTNTQGGSIGAGLLGLGLILARRRRNARRS